MSVPTSQEISTALNDVRRAYRLLHEYQRSAMDAVKYIGNQLGLSYVGGYPWFSRASPREGRGDLDDWAWDWLNMVFYDFNFETDDTEGKNAFSLSILLFSDTGYYVSQNDAPEETDIHSFAPSELSETLVGFMFYKEWEDGFDEAIDNREAIAEFIKTRGKCPPLLEEKGVSAMVVPFSRIADPMGASVVIDELVAFASSRNYTLERISE